MKPTVAVALSGGVDSLMAAYLLKQSGFSVFGIHFATGYESGRFPEEDLSEQLGIEVFCVDLKSDFNTVVVDYFVRTYTQGRTPNPCLICNPSIKFGVLMAHARRLGADEMATGHYARTVRDPKTGVHLLRGVDPKKDQSYFLAFLTADQLQRARFPLGAMCKEEVKKRAAEAGLRPLVRKESQDVCFIRTASYTEFLAKNRAELSPPGEIVELEGRVIGKHAGLHRFTVGQRRGINCPSAEPYYVLELDHVNNRLVVGRKADTLSPICRVTAPHWIRPPASRSLRVHTRVRYRHEAVPSTLTVEGRGALRIRFDTPQSAVTPGQGAVFYRGDEVLGGGFIE